MITSGIYSLVRHPGYAANFILNASYFYLATGKFIPLIGFFVLFYLNWGRRMDNEENMLIEHYGNEYKNYMKKTKYRILPYIY